MFNNMAAISLRKGFIFTPQNLAVNFQKCLTYATTAKNKLPKQTKTIKAVGESIAAKGFLRPHKQYAPTSNVAERVRSIAATLQLAKGDDKKIVDMSQKFEFLAACFRELKHGVPNSQVHELHSVADVIAFYETPVDTTVPLDALKRIELPQNLHIQYEYLRFHPATDTKFNGQTAFPKSSTLVTGLKYRGKYEGHEAKRSWP